MSRYLLAGRPIYSAQFTAHAKYRNTNLTCQIAIDIVQSLLKLNVLDIEYFTIMNAYIKQLFLNRIMCLLQHWNIKTIKWDWDGILVNLIEIGSDYDTGIVTALEPRLQKLYDPINLGSLYDRLQRMSIMSNTKGHGQ